MAGDHTLDGPVTAVDRGIGERPCCWFDFSMEFCDCDGLTPRRARVPVAER
jgi:hypothetical protein